MIQQECRTQFKLLIHSFIAFSSLLPPPLLFASRGGFLKTKAFDLQEPAVQDFQRSFPDESLPHVTPVVFKSLFHPEESPLPTGSIQVPLVARSQHHISAFQSTRLHS